MEAFVKNPDLWRPRLLFLLGVLSFVVGSVPQARAVDEPAIREPKKLKRMHAYFLKVPTLELPCEELELVFEPILLNGIEEAKRHAFQQLRTKGGKYEAKLEEIRSARKELSVVYEELLMSAAATYRAESLGMLASVKAAGRDLPRHWYNIGRYYLAIADPFRLEGELRTLADEYYKTFFGVAAALSADKQEAILEAFLKRLACLRTHRRAAFAELYAYRIALVKQIAEFVKKDVGGKTPEIPDRVKIVDDANAYVRMQGQYWLQSWLNPEFSKQLELCSKLVKQLEATVTNLELQPLLEAAPATHPSRPLGAGPESRNARARIARTRAVRGLLSLYQNEAKLELAYVQKLAAVTFGWGPFKELYDLFMASERDVGDAPHFLDQLLRGMDGDNAGGGSVSLTRFLAVGTATGYSFFGNSFDIFVGRLGKDAIKQLARNATGIDVWKSSVEDDHEAYGKQVEKYQLQIKLLEHLAQGLTFDEGVKYLKFLRDGAKGKSPAGGVHGPTAVRDLLGDHEFNSTSGGGLAHIVAPLAENPKDLTGAVLYGAREALSAAVKVGLARVAAARGLPLEDPERAVSAADFDVRAVKSSSDLLTRVPSVIPSLVKDFFGDVSDIYSTQNAYLENLQQQDKDLKNLLSVVSGPDVDFDLAVLPSRHRKAYQMHLALKEHCHVYAEALYQLDKTWWHRVNLYNEARSTRSLGGRAGTVDLARQSGAEIAASMQLMESARKVAFLKLFYFAMTVNYNAAAEQTAACEKLANEQLKTWKKPGNVDLSDTKASFEAIAMATRSVQVWKQFLKQATSDAVFGHLTDGNTSLAFERMHPTWVARFAARETGDVLSRLMGTFNPWWGKFSTSGVWGVITSQAADLAKSGVVEEIARRHNQLFSTAAFSGKNIEAVVGAVWDVMDGVLENVSARASLSLGEASVAWHSDFRTYTDALQAAEEARATLDEAYDRSSKKALADLAGVEDWSKLDPTERRRAFEEVGAAVRGELDNGGGKRALGSYTKAHRELAEVYERRQQIEAGLRNLIVLLPLSEAVKTGALEGIRGRAYLHASRAADLSKPAGVVASAELRSRLTVGAHSAFDLAALTDSTLHGLRGQVFRRSIPIEVVRSALEVSIEEAKSYGDSDAVRQVRELAKDIDGVRVTRINGLLADFMTESPLASGVVSVIQGGAAEGNPEYQGVFGDIDFTVFTKDGVDRAPLRRALLEFFAAKGYPLAESAEKPSSMDSEVFVQPSGRFDSTREQRHTVIERLQEQRSDPTRFYTEGGMAWFTNNVAYSGRVLWAPSGSRGLPPVNVSRHMGHGLAIDMCRFLGFLVYPKYSKGSLQAMLEQDPDRAHELLGAALCKTKYFLRLIDAYQVAHQSGSEEYNTRLERLPPEQRTGLNASYHYQIFRDAEAMVAKERNGGPKTIFSEGDVDTNLKILRWMAEMQLKGENETPWRVLEKSGLADATQQLQAAFDIVGWMQRMAPKILAHNANVWHQDGRRSTTSPDGQEQRAAFASLHRMLSAVRSVGELDGAGVACFIVPKAVVNGDRVTVLTTEAHEQLIVERMNRALRQPKTTTERLAEIAAEQPIHDLDGAETRQSVDEELALVHQALDQAERSAEVLHEEIYNPWIHYMIWMAGGGKD